MLLLAACGFALVRILNEVGVRSVPVYAVVGALIWLFVYKSGVHPTVAGVMLGLLTPSAVWVGRDALRLKFDRAPASYWVEREPAGPAGDSLGNQF